MSREEHLGHPCNSGKREQKNPTLFYVIVEEFPAVPWGNELSAEGTVVVTRTVLGQRSGDRGEAPQQFLSPLPVP